MLENILLFLLAGIVLVISGGFLVKSLSKIAEFLGISEFSAAFIIMAIATSLPELFVGISSAMIGNPQLSLGNVIGANILNLTLITGIIILVAKEIKFTTKKIGEDAYLMLFSLILMISLYLINKSLSRIDGAILLCFFAFNIYRKFARRKKFRAKIKKEKAIGKKNVGLNMIIFMIALAALFISSSFAVKYASLLAIDLNLPKILVGLFMLSIATTLPELVFGIRAARSEHKVMGIGDQIGTIITNTVLIIGVVSLIHPITVEFIPFITSSIFMFISAFIFLTFLKTGKKFETLEGISLILIYILFIIIEFFIK